MKNLRRKVGLITGSTGGIGKGIAHHLASLGVQVVVTSDALSRLKSMQSGISLSYGQRKMFPSNPFILQLFCETRFCS